MGAKMRKRCFSAALAVIFAAGVLSPLPSRAAEVQVSGQEDTEVDPEKNPEEEVIPEPEKNPEEEVIPEPEKEPEEEVIPEPEKNPEEEVIPIPEKIPEKEIIPAPENILAEGDMEPYIIVPGGVIRTPEELLAWVEFLESDLPSDWTIPAITLEADIDMADYCNKNPETEWKGLGTKANKLKGSFDGKGHVVTLPGKGPGLINYASNLALSNVTVKSAAPIESSNEYGAAAGIAANAEYSTISNCVNQAAVQNSSGTSRENIYVGGIVGYASDTKIAHCWNSGVITGSQINGSENAYAGGIAGGLSAGQAAVSECFNIGTVKGSTAGGIVGNMKDSSLKNCYNSGYVTGENAAGLAGEMEGSSVITSINTGSVTAEITSNPVAIASGGTVKNCYYDNIICKGTGSAGSEGKTTYELLTTGKSLWTETNDSWNYEGGYYPMLKFSAGDSAAAAKVASAAAYVPSDGYVSLSAGSWSAEGDAIDFGSSLKLPSVLTYENGGFSKNVELPDPGSWSGDYYVVTGTKLTKWDIPIKVQITLDGKEIPAQGGIYQLPYNSRPDIKLTASGSVSLDNLKWLAQIPDETGLTLSPDAAGTETRITGAVSPKPGQESFRILLCAGVPDHYYNTYEFYIQVKEGAPEFAVTLPEAEPDPVYDGRPVEVLCSLPDASEQPNLDKSQIAVSYYCKEGSSGWILTTPENSGASAEGKEPVRAGSYKAVVNCAANEYYQSAQKELEYTIRQRSLTDAMLTDTDWSVPESLNSAEARKHVIVRETDTDIVEATGRELLREGKEYTLTYAGTTELGTASVTVTGIGNYTGTLGRSYEIRIGSWPNRLKPGNPSVLGEGSWYLKEQPDVIYYGGSTFCVPSEGEYVFLPVWR
ncbi:MAG: hypothetical protein KH452_05305 [Clostridiales bacterium]|nr:hypothetical protein [Clostridiales bacterium]